MESNPWRLGTTLKGHELAIHCNLGELTWSSSTEYGRVVSGEDIYVSENLMAYHENSIKQVQYLLGLRGLIDARTEGASSLSAADDLVCTIQEQ